jgi:hypothetical protein
MSKAINKRSFEKAGNALAIMGTLLASANLEDSVANSAFTYWNDSAAY